MKSHVRSLLVAFSVALACAAPSLAADAPRADLFAGYSYHGAEGGGLNGWQASLGWNLWGKLVLLADASGHYTSEEGVDIDDLTFMGGLRFALLQPYRGILPWVRFESGYMRTTDPLNAFGFTLRQRNVSLASFNPATLNGPDPIGNLTTGLVLEAPLLNFDAWYGRSAAASAHDATRAAEDWTSRAREVRRRRFGVSPPGDYAERARQARFLQYRGFSNEQIRAALGPGDDIDPLAPYAHRRSR